MKLFSGIFAAIGFFLCLWLIVSGQRNVGVMGLGVMIAGLSGLILLLYLYNRNYK